MPIRIKEVKDWLESCGLQDDDYIAIDEDGICLIPDGGFVAFEDTPEMYLEVGGISESA